MAISETSKAPSRTIGLKPLLVGEYSAKSSVTRSDLIEPFFSADVPGWSPSKVRKRIVISIGQGFIEIDEARLLQRLAHIVHVEPEHANGKLLAPPLFVGLSMFALGRALGGFLPAHDPDAIAIGDHGVSGHHIGSR